MKFSLISVSKQVGAKVTGNWLQNHVGTLETATARAIEYENSQPITVAVVDEVPSPVPMLTLWEDRQRLDRIARADS